MSEEQASAAANGFSGALATLTATATTIGTATGGLAFLLRNSPTFTLVAFLLSVASALLAVLYLTPLLNSFARMRAATLLSSAVLLFVGLMVMVWSQSQLLKLSSRPVIVGEWVRVDTNEAVLRLTITAESLARDDILYSAVVGIANQESVPGQGEAAAALAAGGGVVQTFTLYSGSTGPDSDGRAKQSQDIVVPRRSYNFSIEAIEISSVVIEESQLRGWSTKLNAIPVATGSAAPPSRAPSSVATPDPGRVSRKARITSLDCDGQISAVDSTSGLPIATGSLGSVEMVSCVNIATLPERGASPTPTPT